MKFVKRVSTLFHDPLAECPGCTADAYCDSTLKTPGKGLQRFADIRCSETVALFGRIRFVIKELFEPYRPQIQRVALYDLSVDDQ